LVSLVYVGGRGVAGFYSDPADDVGKPNTTGTGTGTSAGASKPIGVPAAVGEIKMAGGSSRFHYRRVVDSGRPESEVWRYIVETTRTGVTDRPSSAASSQASRVAVSMKEGMTRLSRDASESRQMAQDLSALIAASPFDGVFFETPGVDATSVSTTPFEFVLVNAPSLARFAESRPDEHAFAEHLDRCPTEQTCCAFDNLGGDARLIAPRSAIGSGVADGRTKRDAKVYSHLASFVRGADEDQIADLWRLSASEYLRVVVQDGRAGGKTWFSTSGLGVAWLHVRLDSDPKYYQYNAFKV